MQKEVSDFGGIDVYSKLSSASASEVTTSIKSIGWYLVFLFAVDSATDFVGKSEFSTLEDYLRDVELSEN
ncbi:hypothetical protein RI065_06525 [Mycoplasmatota bacterium zrk1]